MRTLFLLLACGLAVAAQAAAIYPIDRATILAGSKFDFKVEFDGIVDRDRVKVTINGVDHAAALGRAATFVENEDGLKASSLLLRDVSLTKPGRYRIEAGDGTHSMAVTWEVFATGSRKAKNVILFIGDGMAVANRTAARMLGKGIKEGKYLGKLSFDDMPHMALIGTSGMDSIITDSANSMSAYCTGHKSAVNAMGVYASRAKDNLAHPRVETLTELIKRKTKMAVGIVTDAEIQDATPAGMFAHTRRRSDKDIITEQLFFSRADVIMGGGSAYFMPSTQAGSKRKDSNSYVPLFRADGYAFAATDAEMKAAAANRGTARLLGLFHPDNMDGALDRRYLKKGTVDKFPDQPDVADMTRAALDVLSRNQNGFVLMVEAGLIDKFNHPLDWERSVYDTIMLSNAVQVAKDFAARHRDTLIIVVPDHTHGVSIVGTIDDDKPGSDMREKVGVYELAGFPNYPPPDAAGYPPSVDVSRRLAMFYGNTPDYYETFRPKLDGPFEPSVGDADKNILPNPKYRDVPGAILRVGNLSKTGSRASPEGTHTADDGVLTAMGPGSEQFHGFMDNTEVFRVIVNSLGLAPGKPAKK
ncbi:MAG: alkaline phosphatase [Betaproteobacteria bacterium]|nr:alkaline phosphatase [Betaproteobacteria bacterium]